MAARWFAVVPRGRPSLTVRLVFPLASVLGAAAIGAGLLLIAGHGPLEAYRLVGRAGFGTKLAWVRTLISATPLILASLAAAVAFRMKVWNIGGEGQLYVGAIAASGVALALGDSASPIVTIPASLGAGVAAGGLWAALAALPRAYLRTDEVISTLMLNFVALHLMDYLIFGSESFWRDKNPFYSGFPSGRAIPEAAELPRVWLRLHAGFLVALGVAVLIWWVLRSSRWGFGVRVIGDSPLAARYAGMNVPRRIASVLVASGAIAGLGGAILLTGSTHALQPNGIAVGIGYTGIVVAAVSQLNPLAILPVSILIAGLTNAGSSLQAHGIPNNIVVLLQGLVLVLVAAAQFFLHNRVRLVARLPSVPVREPV